MAAELNPNFDVSPETQAGLGHFFRQQLFFRPSVVTGVDLSGQTAIVTGSNCGIGLEVSRQLLDLRLSRLILAVRSEDKGKAAAAELALNRDPALKDGAIEVWKLDMSNYDSITAFAERASSLGRLDIAVLNAGLCPLNRTVNKRTGHDEIIQVNYLSTALLAILLLPIAKAKSKNPEQKHPTRITMSMSEVAYWAKPPLSNDTPLLKTLDQDTKGYATLDQMFVSKLLGQYLIAELAKRTPASVAIINGASPGSCHDTQYNRELRQTFHGKLVQLVLKRVANTSAVGTRMMTDAAVNHGEASHGQFLSFQKIVPCVL